MGIRVSHLSFGYDGREVLSDISMTLEKGCFTVILGKNGSGKSTLFRIMAGILKPWRGSLEIAGRSMADMTLRERARILGFLPQHHRPVFPFRVDDVVITGRAGRIVLTPGRQDRTAAREAMDRVGIGHLRRCLFTELSGGEQQLVMIARVLAQNPAIVLLDEPTSHLDFYYQAKVMGVIRELVSEGLTAVAVLHDPNQAMMYGQRLLFLRQGRLLERGGAERPDDVQLLEQVYGMALEMVGDHRRRLVVPRP
jgi:iron complex transport system ATP-binding protein